MVRFYRQPLLTGLDATEDFVQPLDPSGRQFDGHLYRIDYPSEDLLSGAPVCIALLESAYVGDTCLRTPTMHQTRRVAQQCIVAKPACS